MKETLEEAAENYGWRIKTNIFSDQVKANELAESAKQDFIEGAKWQAERMYSEEEVRLMLSESFKASQEGYNITADEIIKQHKKK